MRKALQGRDFMHQLIYWRSKFIKMDKIKIILVDDHQMFREGLKFLLTGLEFFEVIGEAVDGADFIKLLSVTSPDVVLMDINMPNMNGIEATQKALLMKPNLKVIVLSMYGDESYYYQMIQAGARGFVFKKSGSSELALAINAVMNGEEYFSNELLKNVIMSFGYSKKITAGADIKVINFTSREQEVLTLICNGLSAKEIAAKLNISIRTVEVHKSNLFQKTGAKTTGNLISLAIKSNLVSF
jgi:DNA-binding NarL/FixJ family response regulator